MLETILKHNKRAMRKVKLPSDTTKLVHKFYKKIKVSGNLPYKITRRVEGYNGKYRRVQGCHRLETSFFPKKSKYNITFSRNVFKKIYSFRDLN